MKLKVTVKTQEEIEVSLPLYFKLVYKQTGDVFYALFDNDRAMRVDIQSPQVQCTSTSIYLDNYGAINRETITEAEFKQAFETCMEKIVATLPENF